MKRFFLAVVLLVAGRCVPAAVPLAANLDPALYVPYATYLDAGTGQSFYYDPAARTFFVYEGAAPAPACAGNVCGVVDGGLHAIAMARAAAMAALDLFAPDHNIPNAPLRPYWVSEGLGMGYGPAPATCEFPGACVADAAAVSASGRTYRVRFFQ